MMFLKKKKKKKFNQQGLVDFSKIRLRGKENFPQHDLSSVDCGLPFKGPKNITVNQARGWSQYLISVKTALQAQCKQKAKCGQKYSSIYIWNRR